MGKWKGLPPNLRAGKCCGTCAHWEWGYEGEGQCKKFPIRYSKKTFKASHDEHSAFVCDAWEEPK